MSADSPAVGVRGARGMADGTAFTVYGAGNAVVLVHGVGMTQAVWGPQIASLSQTHQVIVYDMLGHGDSHDPRPDAALVDFAEQLAALLDHLQIDSAAVVGHSMGALVALDFALRHPRRTQRIVALNAVFMRSPEQKSAVLDRVRALRATGITSTLDATVARWFGDPVPADLQASAGLVKDMLTHVHPAGYATAYGIFADSDTVHEDRLPMLRMPALFMTGEFDPNSTPAMSLAMAQLAPKGAFKMLEGERHMLTMTSADTVNNCLRRFLAGAICGHNPGPVPDAGQ